MLLLINEKLKKKQSKKKQNDNSKIRTRAGKAHRISNPTP